MKVLVPLPIVLPLLTAGLSMALSRRLVLQRALGVTSLAATLAAWIALLVRVEADGVTAVQAGGWPAPLGITLVADLFACVLLVISMTTVLAVLVFAIGHPGSEDTSAIFHPVYLVLTAGVAASFLTGDLFNLFVAFEVMLSASYVLITLGGRPDQVRTGMTYVVVSLLASTLFITALGIVYAATGTVNMADLSGKLADLPGSTRTAIGLLFLVVFGIKAAIFPLFFWLPDAYPTAPAPVTAIFAGLLTKVGVYAIVRSQTLLFPLDKTTSTVVLVLAGFTMIVGVLGAIAQNDIKRILSFHIVSQIGYMVMGLGIYTVAGVAGTIFFLVHQIPVKTSLFLVDGMVESGVGTGALARLGGLARRMPAVAVLFFLAATSLAGIPPLSGFVGKLALVESGFSAGEYEIVAVSLLGSLLTLFSMTKIWNGAFWGRVEATRHTEVPEPVRVRTPRLMLGATTALVGVTLAVAVAARPLYELSERAATTLLDPEPYVQAVLELIRRAVVATWVLVVWVALWEDLSVGNVAGGALVGAFLVTVFPPDPGTEWIRFRPLYVVHFVVYFLFKLVEASVIVAWEVVTPTNRINEGIVAVPVQGASPAMLTVVSNAITLTPGTLTVDVDEEPAVLYVHVLHLRDIEAVRRDVQYLELLAVRAFGSAECRRELESALARPGAEMTFVTTVALVVLSASAAGCVLRLVRPGSLADRIVALDTFVVVLVNGIAVYTIRTGSGVFLDVLLVTGLLGFLGTVTVARFIERRGAR